MFQLTRAWDIARRYFVTNGFDGVLTLFGLLVGFRLSGTTEFGVIIQACLGAAVALGVSGLSSAYISEAAERRKELKALEQAMLHDLSASEYGRAVQLVPLLIACVNGFSPFLLSLLILVPLGLAQKGIPLPWPPLESAIVLALAVMFLLGVFLGRISGTHWLLMGLKAILLGLVTAGLILLIERW